MDYRLSLALGAGLLSLCVPAGAQEVAPATPSPVAAPVVVQATPAIPVVVERPQQVVDGTMLPSNTDIWLSADGEVTSKKMKVGDSMAFKVSRDVMLGQYVVIPRGTPASGRVTYRTGKGVFGKSAKFEFDIDHVTLNGRTIPLAGHYRVEGRGNTGATVGAVVAVGLVGGLFVTGRSATVAQGSEWKASTKEPLALDIASN
jgi:hypothetical protein